eukprot:11154404-Heterocapsa_arctica.AAC.1
MSPLPKQFRRPKPAGITVPNIRNNHTKEATLSFMGPSGRRPVHDDATHGLQKAQRGTSDGPY